MEIRKRPDGSQTVLTTVFRQELNGRFELWKRTTAEVRRTTEGSRSTTVVEIPDLKGGRTSTGAPMRVSANSTERTKRLGLVSETTTEFEADGTGRASGQQNAR